MKKLFNFLLVRRPENENKWWHRLFSVLLFGSGILVVISTLSLTIDNYNHTWITYKPVAFSLEQNYQEAIGKELSCEKTLNFSGEERFIIQCEGIDISPQDANRYKELYDIAENNLEKQFGLDKYNIAKCSKPRINGKLSPEQISCVRENLDAWQADPQYSKYQEALKNIAHIKVARNINFGLMISDIAIWLIGPLIAFLVWIIFWSSIIYRSILYIAFGKKK